VVAHPPAAAQDDGEDHHDDDQVDAEDGQQRDQHGEPPFVRHRPDRRTPVGMPLD